MTKAEWRLREILILEYKNHLITREEFIKRWAPLWIAAMEDVNND